MKVLVSQDMKSSVRTVATLTLLAGLILTIKAATGFPREIPLFSFILAVGLPVLLVASRILSLAAHEAGHALAALAYGLRVKSIRVSGLCFVFHGKGIEPRSDLGGGVYLEESLRRDERWASTVISLAGPAVDLVIAVSAGIAATMHRDVWSLVWLALALSSASNAYTSLVPSASGRQASDIKHVLDYWKPQPQTFAHRALHRVWPILEGEDPSLFHGEDIRRALWIENPSWQRSAVQIATYHAIATRSLEASRIAERFVEQCEDAYDKSETEEDRAAHRVLLEDALLEEAFCRALIDRDLVGSQRLVDRLDWIGKSGYHTARRVDAAQALTRGDHEVALKLVRQARQVLDRERDTAPDPMWATADRFLTLVEEDALRSSGSA